MLLCLATQLALLALIYLCRAHLDARPPLEVRAAPRPAPWRRPLTHLW